MNNKTQEPRIIGLMLVQHIGGEGLCANCLHKILGFNKPQTNLEFKNLADEIADKKTYKAYYVYENDELFSTTCWGCGHDMIEEV